MQWAALMPPVSGVKKLPPEDRDWLNQALIANSFSGYEALAAQLAERGIDISKSALHRYGSEYEENINRLRASQEVASAVVAQIGDDQADLAEAVGQLALSNAMEIMMKMKIDPEKVDFTDLVKAVAALTKSSIGLKEYKASVKARIKEAAQALEKTLKKGGGLSDEAADEIKRKILGIGG
jgi:hypothetical protein